MATFIGEYRTLKYQSILRVRFGLFNISIDDLEIFRAVLILRGIPCNLFFPFFPFQNFITVPEVVSLHAPVQDALTEVLKAGAQKLLAQAIEAEVERFIASYAELKTDPGSFANQGQASGSAVIYPESSSQAL